MEMVIGLGKKLRWVGRMREAERKRRKERSRRREEMEFQDSDDEVIQALKVERMKIPNSPETLENSSPKSWNKTSFLESYRNFIKEPAGNESFDEEILMDKRSIQKLLEEEIRETALQKIHQNHRLRFRIIMETKMREHRLKKHHTKFRAARNREVRNVHLFRCLRKQEKLVSSDSESEPESDENSDEDYDVFEEEIEVDLDFCEKKEKEIDCEEMKIRRIQMKKYQRWVKKEMEFLSPEPEDYCAPLPFPDPIPISSSSSPTPPPTRKVHFCPTKNYKQTFLIPNKPENEKIDIWKPSRLVQGKSIRRVKKFLRNCHRIELVRLEPIVKLLTRNVNSARLCHYMLIRFGLNQCTFHEHVPTNQRIMLVKDPKNMHILFAIDCTFFDHPKIHLVNIETEKYPETYTPLPHCIRSFVLTLAAFVWIDTIFRPIKSNRKSWIKPQSLEHLMSIFAKNHDRIIQKLLVTWRKTRKL